MVEFERSSEEPTPKPEKVGEVAPQPQEQDEASGGLAPEPAEKEVVKLSQPSKELATRLLSKVSFKERVIGVSSHPGPGGIPVSIYSFEEATLFLDGGNLSGKGWVRSLRFDILKKWVDETLGDKELVQAIGEITKEGDQPMTPHQRYLKSLELIKPVKELMEQRLEQCKEIMGIEIVEEETEA